MLYNLSANFLYAYTFLNFSKNHYEKLDLDYREVPVEIMQEYVKKEEKG